MAEEIRELAERVLFSESLSDKLRPVTELVDTNPGHRLVVPRSPARPRSLQFKKGGETAAFPRIQELEQDPARARLLHFFANHELLATELMALVLLKFPDAPPAFRRGVAKTLMEEQAHTQLYMDRMRALGCEFGDYPVTGFIWDMLHSMESPLGYAAGLPLTFEQANLDFSRHFYHVFDELGDLESKDLMDRIYRDEIRHVAYGLKWFRSWKDPKLSDWEAYQGQLQSPLSPRRAKGNEFNVEGRQRCGLDPEFIQALSVFSKSKGRCPDLFFFNPFGELEISQGKSFTPTKQQLEFREDLASLPQFFGGEDDVVLVGQEPRLEWLLTMKKNGLFVPEFEVLREGQIAQHSELRQRTLGAYRPWAITPKSIAVSRPLARRFKHEGFHSASDERIAGLRPLFAKSTSCELLRSVLQEEGTPGWLCPKSDIGVVMEGENTVESQVHERRQAWGQRLVAKADFGAAGNRMQRLWEPELLEGQRRWMEKVLKQGERLVLEPWHERVLDFSAHYEVQAKETKFRGFVRMLNDPRGQFFGASMSAHLTAGLGQALPRFLHGPKGDRHRRLFERLGGLIYQRCSTAGYQGPVGIDAYVYRTSGDTLRLRPVVEMNPRNTMGRLVMDLRRFAAPGKLVTLVLISPVQLKKLGLKSFQELEGLLENRLPLQLQGQAKARIADGAVCLTDPVRARQCVALLLVGEGGYSWATSLMNEASGTD